LQSRRIAIFARELPKPESGKLPSSRKELTSPGVLGPFETAARSIFPLGFSGQCLARPSGIGFSVFIGDMNDRVLLET
jgi:hypothetical protein